MKLRKYMVATLLSTLLLTGCTNKTFDKAMEEGKLAIASEEYSKAENMFSLALEEKENDKEAKALYTQVEKLVKAFDLKDEEKFEEAKKVCEQILEIDSESDLIKKQAKSLNDEIDTLIASSKESSNEKIGSDINQTEEQEPVEEKVYTRSEVNVILQQQNKGGLYEESDFEVVGMEDVYIDGELCYPGQIVWANGNRIRDFFVGSKTLSIYNYKYEKKGTVYSEIIPFDTEF